MSKALIKAIELKNIYRWFDEMCPWSGFIHTVGFWSSSRYMVKSPEEAICLHFGYAYT